MIEIFDGGMGTMLQARGLKPGACPELMNAEQPEIVAGVHRDYIAAGATYITTNTFGASPLKLEHYGLSDRCEELNEAAAKCARRAIAESGRRDVKVAGDIGPTGRFVEPLGDLDFEAAYDNFYRQAVGLLRGGVDAFIIETMIDMGEMRAALIAVKDAIAAEQKADNEAGHHRKNIQIICQFTYAEDLRTVTGTDPVTAAVTLDALGADVIGANCSLGPNEYLSVVKQLITATDKPIIIQPNAGMPQLVDGKTIFPMGPETFGEAAPKLVAAGAGYLGGCCGTTPDHIRAVAEAVKGLAPVKRETRPRRLQLTSRTKTVIIDKDLPPIMIGERINPTGRKKLAAEIKDGSFTSVKKEAIGQTRAGASVLDVNMGVGGIDQAAAMKRAMLELTPLTDLPLAIDTSDATALEAALRIYPGRALINSVSAEPERLEKFLPLAKKYGAAILCLPLEKDLPKTAEARVELIRKIIEAARKAGLQDGDFLLDGLVLTVASDASAAKEVLRALTLYRQEFGYPSTMGLSNISFGLPNRPIVNHTFYAMCLAAGLDAPIMNPYDDGMKDTLSSAKALLGIDANGVEYSKEQSGRDAVKVAVSAAAIDPKADIMGALKAAVIDGDKDSVGDLVAEAIAQGREANDITSNALTAAMNEIGADFGAGRIFLPQVLLSAETMKASFDRLKEILPAAADTARLGTFVIATVKGDVHDLGKNIVAALLENSGFRVIDLGKDVEADEIVAAANENKADIVGLCALMTTTMPELDIVIEKLKAAGSPAKVMVGGAAVTDDYARDCGADSYAKDGVAAVNIAREIVGAM